MVESKSLLGLFSWKEIVGENGEEGFFEACSVACIDPVDAKGREADRAELKFGQRIFIFFS